MTMTVKLSTALLFVGALLLIVAAIVGLSPVSITFAYQVSSCGSVISHDPGDLCGQALQGRTVTTWALAVPAILLLIAGGVTRVNEKDAAEEAARN